MDVMYNVHMYVKKYNIFLDFNVLYLWFSFIMYKFDTNILPKISLLKREARKATLWMDNIQQIADAVQKGL